MSSSSAPAWGRRSTGRTSAGESSAARIEAANKKLKKAAKPPIADGITNHTCRRTFASLLYETGASPAYVMSQMGHTSASMALEVYAKKIDRARDTGARLDALVRGADRAQTGTNDADGVGLVMVEAEAA